MSVCNSEIKLKRWDTRDFVVEALNDDWTPIDITTATIYFTARLPSTADDLTDWTAKITKSKAPPHNDPVNGITNMSLDANDTDEADYYVWEIVIVDWTSTISTEQGDLTIEQDLTKTVLFVYHYVSSQCWQVKEQDNTKAPEYTCSVRVFVIRKIYQFIYTERVLQYRNHLHKFMVWILIE